MHTNNVGEVVIDENDAVLGLLKGKRIKNAVSIDTAWAEQYNNSIKVFESGSKLDYSTEHTGSTEQYVLDCIDSKNWNMPEEYKSLNVEFKLDSKLQELGHGPDSLQRQRVTTEYSMYKERNLIPVLQFLIYLVDVAKENNIVLGVGRGSSVASYILYLLGIHKVDSLAYNLDIKEFLK
jgi:DNA polymerase III alpha subunit